MTNVLRTSKDRSPNFPFIPLATALHRAAEFYANERRGSAPFTVAIGHWKMSPLSSGALQTVAALKNYGLMAEEGSGAARKVRLTELALRIILDNRPDSEERLAHMRQAAYMPAIAAEIHAMWPGDLPSEANLHHFLVLERKFNAATAHKVVKIIQHNHEIIGSSSSSPDENMSTDGHDMPQSDRMPNMDAPSPVRVTAHTLTNWAGAPPYSEGGATPFIAERVAIGDAVLSIQITGQPTAAVFEFLEQYGKARKLLLGLSS